MIEGPELPAWAALLTAFCVLGGAGLTLIGCLGLLRLDNFYRRVHAPTLGTTLGAGGILIGSMICYSVLETRPVLHEILIALMKWGNRWAPHPDGPAVVLRHRGCGSVMEPALACPHCGDEVHARDIEALPGPARPG